MRRVAKQAPPPLSSPITVARCEMLLAGGTDVTCGAGDEHDLILALDIAWRTMYALAADEWQDGDGVDNTDLRMLATLQAKPEMSIHQIAESVGLSSTPCWRRMKKMEADGVIVGRAVLLDAKSLNLNVNIFADIRLRQHDEETLNALEDAVRGRPEIVECFSVSGESDYIVRVVMRSIEHYEAFLKKVLLHLPGVSAVNSRFALGCVKMTTALPI